ncbi:unnamed protein product [Mytilus edulis]|uniref:Uncharacterized protein n=1 Tax=Mytilus edulis TaxID=6550 RepID=A0A8S3TJ93_MYTED|nr:unnamed protein product [Mytilus edulis]
MTDQIVMFAMKQSSWGQRRPIQWVPLELQISNMRMKNVNIIRKEDLRNVDMLNGDLALSEPMLNDFLQVKHSLGELIYYHLPGLDKFVIIHPLSLVNILRSFVTDEQFFPVDQNLNSILQNLIKTGIINKTDLLQLWQQDHFHQYMQNDSSKEFVILLLQHLDILINLKRSKQTHVYLVPCVIKTVRPSNFHYVENQKENTICMRYTIARHSIPTSLAYQIVGALTCTWPLKYEDKQPYLYHKAAWFNVSDENELRIWIEGNHIIVMLTNDLALLYVMDVAASVQNVLQRILSRPFCSIITALEQISQKKYQSCTMEVGVPCGHNVCYTSLQNVIMNEKWICGQKMNHDTRYLRYWVFSKGKNNVVST